MPFAQSNLKEDENKNQQSQGGAQNISGTGTSFSTGVPGQNAGAGKKSSGQYANIQSYLDANKDQATQMGTKIAGDVEKQGQEAQSGISGLQSQKPTVEAYDPNAALSNVTGLSAEDKKKYQETKATGGYTGPSSLSGVSGYQDVETKAKQASDLAKGAATVGQQSLLKQAYQRPNYSAGQNKLDQVLLGGSSEAKGALQDVSSKYSGLNDLFKDTSTQLGEGINQALQTAQKNREAFSTAEQSARSGLLDPIKKRADDLNAQSPAAIERAMNDLQDENIYQDILSGTGLKEGTKIYGLNLANYLNPNQTQAGVNNVATDAERQKYAALSDLFQDPTMQEITDTGKQINPYTFNMDKFNADRAAKEQEYNTAYTSSKGTISLTPNSFSGTGNEVYKSNLAQGLLNQYTPEYLENVLIPQYENPPEGLEGRKEIAAALKSSLDGWKNKYQVNRAIGIQQEKLGQKDLGLDTFNGV